MKSAKNLCTSLPEQRITKCCHPEPCCSAKDLRRCVGLKRRWQGSFANVPRLLALLLIVPLASVAPAFAQGCASCYTTAAAGGSQTIHALRSGILVLLVPPVLLFIGIIFLLLRWRRTKVCVISTTREMDAIQ